MSVALRRIVILLSFALLSACRGEVEQHAAAMTGGDPSRAPALIRHYGCGSCHLIPGIRGADSLVGPSLEHFASRMLVAGDRPNNPENLIRWIRHPQHLEPGTAMPEMGVTADHARDIAAYLYTLR